MAKRYEEVKLFVPVSEARLMAQAGKWIDGKFSATYMIMWRSLAKNQLPPYTDEDICEAIQVGNFEGE